MATMNKQMNLPQIQKIMMEFEKQVSSLQFPIHSIFFSKTDGNNGYERGDDE